MAAEKLGGVASAGRHSRVTPTGREGGREGRKGLAAGGGGVGHLFFLVAESQTTGWPHAEPSSSSWLGLGCWSLSLYAYRGGCSGAWQTVVSGRPEWPGPVTPMGCLQCELARVTSSREQPSFIESLSHPSEIAADGLSWVESPL